MNYYKFRSILNKHIFKDEKKELLKKLADSPKRFLGLFRPTKPGAKIFQHLLQSHEIRFGDAMEEIISEFLKDWGFKFLQRKVVPDPKNPEKNLYIDQYFTDGSTYYFIEQKVRDDHDSSKKRGQISNFEAKLQFLYREHKQNLIGIMYFLDPDLVKNKKYYIEELSKMENTYRVKLYLFYGQELFKFFDKLNDWNNLLSWLTRWKESLPELPEINFDSKAENSFNEIKDLEIRIWKKILKNEKLWEEGIMLAIFRSGTTLEMLFEYFNEKAEKKGERTYRKLAEMIKQKLEKYYKISKQIKS